jgi:hypothetical protein
MSEIGAPTASVPSRCRIEYSGNRLAHWAGTWRISSAELAIDSTVESPEGMNVRMDRYAAM